MAAAATEQKLTAVEVSEKLTCEADEDAQAALARGNECLHLVLERAVLATGARMPWLAPQEAGTPVSAVAGASVEQAVRMAQEAVTAAARSARARAAAADALAQAREVTQAAMEQASLVNCLLMASSDGL